MARTESRGDEPGAAGRATARLILICLGNPGRKYVGTRHNAGRFFADYLVERYRLSPFAPVEGAEAVAAEGEIGGLPVLVIEHTTAMNDCGRVVLPLRERYGADDVLWAVAHDDVDLPLGSTKGRLKGGHGGHNGVRAILKAAGDLQFFRIKLGVNSTRKRDYDSVADFLLSDFEPDEGERLKACFPRAEQVLVGQAKSHAAALARRGRRKDVKARYLAEVFDDACAALNGLPAASPYPVFLNRVEAARLFDVATALAKLLRKAKRAATEDGEFRTRLLAFIPEGLRPLLASGPRSQRAFFAADVHLADGRIKVIELNCAVGYGHWARLADEALYPLIQGQLGEVERPVETEFASFLYEQGLKPLHDPSAGLIAFLRGFNNQDMFNADEVAGLARRIEENCGVAVPLCHERDLELRREGLYLGDGRRVDLLYVEENLSEWQLVAQDSALLKAVREGTVKTFPPLDMFLYTNKGFLCLLTDPAARKWFAPDEEESKIIRENVLWSHPLDEHVEPAAYYMLEQGLALVVKGVLGGGGREVTVLRPDSSSQQTGHILRRRMLDGDAIVQGYSPPGRWSPEPDSSGSDLSFDVRVLVAAHEDDIAVGPVYGRIFRGEKVNFSGPDAGVAPVYVLR